MNRDIEDLRSAHEMWREELADELRQLRIRIILIQPPALTFGIAVPSYPFLHNPLPPLKPS